jgi:hypothetical protein
MEVFDHAKESRGKAVRGVCGLPPRVGQGRDGIEATIRVVVTVDKNSAHFFSGLVSGLDFAGEVGFAGASAS